ncbi:secretion-regulating guanine nucleotide exchange factor-like isoform X2 [Porites lutea]|uniref:secretion-regulating guanine nucleotide exchange factor-like isoform X2 n=1 Tax=Porites lutea TaxID=51062 RepID=UPI003CC5CC64
MAAGIPRNNEETQLFSWGANSHGQLCLGHTDDVLIPESFDDSPENTCKPIEVALIEGGGGHTAVITVSQGLFMCGWNNKGQLGLGDTEDRAVLCHVQGLPPVTQVSCGWNHTLAITDHGLYVWGSNAFGQLGMGKLGGYLTRPTLCKEFTEYQQVISVAAGLRHSIVALADGSVWCWGANKKGQLGFGKTSRNSVTPLQVSIPDCCQKFVQVVAGSHHSAALTASGQVFCWGSNQHGQCGRPPEHCAQIFANPQLIRGAISDKHIAQLKSGWSHHLAITEDGQIFSWGRADYGQLGVGDDVVQQGFCSEPTQVVQVSGAKQVVCGAEHNMVLLGCGSVMTWGWNEHGICGTGDEINIHLPGVVAKLQGSRVSVIGCGGGHSFAVVSR